ncbi:MAG: hypothetical protein NG737_07625, partial [Omnitrophica bacterium]|nr:hypothetical protein [Candidatus Omnitrophota bacterium]
IAKEIKPLVEEAKKFKTAEEFVEAQLIKATPPIPGITDREGRIKEFMNTRGMTRKEATERVLTLEKEAPAKRKSQLTDIWKQAQKETGIDIKAKQIKGRLAKLDSEIKDVRKEMDTLEKQRKEFKKLGKSTKQIEAKITELIKREDTIDSERADLLISQKELIKLGKEKIEITAQELLKNINQGIREGTIRTKEQIKKTQTELVDIIEKQTALEAKDKAKFLRTIKNIQTPEQLAKTMPEIIRRVSELERKADINRMDTQIKKELKRTKPLKKGQKRVEKYEYESSKLFNALRGYSKMTQIKAQAELDTYPEEGLSEFDLIKKRFLSLKANGKGASAEIYNKVLEDITKMKEIGRAVKDDAEMMDKINQQDVIDNAQEAMEKIKTTTKEYKRKARVAYLRGVGNINSMLNAIFGKKIANEFNPELEENARGTAIFHQGKKISDATEKMYNGDIVSILKKMTEDTYDIVDSTGLFRKINRRDVINIYNAIKNEHIKKRFFDSFGETQITALMGKLDTVDKEFGDMMMTTVQGYKDIHNQMSIETTGRDNGVVENYWPANSEYNQNVYDDIRVQGETPSAQKERARGKVLPKLVDSWDVAMKHIAQGEHVDKLSRKYIELKRLLSDVAIKDRIIDYYGKKIYSDLMNLVESVSLNALGEQVDIINAVTGHMVNSWVVSKVAFNPSTLVRQLISTGFYTETMGLTEWGKGFVEGVKSPKETFNFMWKNAPFLEARFNRGYSEALSNALEGASKISEVASSATKLFTVLARSGDITAIIYGGYPMVKAELAKHGDMKKAIAVFEAATIKAQQSGLSSSRSLAQNNRNGFMRMFFAFKNTPSQIGRKIGDAIISFENKDIGKSQLAKTLTIYGVISPVAYILAGYLTALPFVWLRGLLGNAYDDDEEDKAIREIVVQLIVNPVNWAPGISHITNYYARKVMGLKAYKLASIPVIDDVYKGMRKLEKKEPTFLDYLQALSSITEPIIPNPGNTFIRYYNKVMKTSGRKEYK